MTFKKSFYKIFIPISSSIFLVTLFNIENISIKKFIEIVFLAICFSLLFALILFGISKLYEIHQKNVLEKIRRTFNGENVSKNIVEFDFRHIKVFGERYIDLAKKVEIFKFHIPRMYIQKYVRKDFNFIKPSTLNKTECFIVFEVKCMTRKNFNKIEERLSLIDSRYANKNNSKI